MTETPRVSTVAPDWRTGSYDRLLVVATELELELNNIKAALRDILDEGGISSDHVDEIIQLIK